VRRVIRDAAKQQYRISAFVQGIADTAAFRMSAAPAADTTARRD
jgi:hypothetical protein